MNWIAKLSIEKLRTIDKFMYIVGNTMNINVYIKILYHFPTYTHWTANNIFKKINSTISAQNKYSHSLDKIHNYQIVIETNSVRKILINRG